MKEEKHMNWMQVYKFMSIVGLLLMMLSVNVNGQTGQQSGKADSKAIFCISQEEMILFNLVNDYRRQNKLPDIPLSKSMCVVAKTHIDDLLKWKPQEQKCGFHSWSEHGNWKPCCFNKDPMGGKKMNSKPSEICGYPGFGFELVYWEEETATANEAYDLWIQVGASKDMLLNRGKWQNRSWKAMGIGIQDGFALIWLGDKLDKAADISICGMDTLIQTKVQAQFSPEPSAETRKVKVEKVEAVKPVVPAKDTKQDALTSEVTISQKQSQAKGDKKSEISKEIQITPFPADKTADKDNHYYLIVASFPSEDLAKQRIVELKNLGYTDVILLPSGGRFRVSIGSYPTEGKTKARMKELRETFPDCWLFRQ
jgi:hypothetical protein